MLQKCIEQSENLEGKKENVWTFEKVFHPTGCLF